MSNISKTECLKDDIIIKDIMLLLSKKTFEDSEALLDKAKLQLKIYCKLDLTTERHEFIKESILKDLPNH